MSINCCRFVFLLTLWSSLFSIISTVPSLGVQRDLAREFPTELYSSYSAIIEFNDKSIPGNKTKMSDAQFINLAKVAYEEMIDTWSRSNSKSAECPGALISMESEGIIYFASSVRAHNSIDFNAADRAIQDSVGWFQQQCKDQGMGTHKTGGKCAEPNVLRLYGDKNGMTTDDPPKYKAPPTDDFTPRVAVWGRRGGMPNQNGEKYLPPCQVDGPGYGCTRLVAVYGLQPVTEAVPDPNGQDDWIFSIPENPRKVCAAPSS